MEEWTYNLIKKDLFKILSDHPNVNPSRFIQIWPFISNVNELAPDMNNLLQPQIDITYCIGGDGTLLNLI